MKGDWLGCLDSMHGCDSPMAHIGDVVRWYGGARVAGVWNGIFVWGEVCHSKNPGPNFARHRRRLRLASVCALDAWEQGVQERENDRGVASATDLGLFEIPQVIGEGLPPDGKSEGNNGKGDGILVLRVVGLLLKITQVMLGGFLGELLVW
jgi:hypothetical protein